MSELMEFEKCEDLKGHILRMAQTGSTGSVSDWCDFISCLNRSLRQRDALLEALKRIEAWSELDIKFRVDYGSNGERDYYRNIAAQSISKCEAQS